MSLEIRQRLASTLANSAVLAGLDDGVQDIDGQDLVRLILLAQFGRNRDKALTQELSAIDDQQRDLESKLDVLTSLEKIGTTTVSERPVRPRRLRVLILLTLAGLLAGFVLAFVREYVARNRNVIFARSGH